jgi:putative addiction module component (TIGR02574 family)
MLLAVAPVAGSPAFRYRLSMSTKVGDLLRLSEAERIQLAQDLWDSIPEKSTALSLSGEQRSELARRLAEHDRDPSTAIPWSEARQRLKDRFGA